LSHRVKANNNFTNNYFNDHYVDHKANLVGTLNTHRNKNIPDLDTPRLMMTDQEKSK